MKKIFITLLILIIAGGALFFFGWAQFSVPPGAYGVAVSKTHGVDSRLIRSGEFRWIWYKIIPANMEITVFRLEPVYAALNTRNALPSGSTYAAFAGTSADFSWELNASLSFSINPDKLIQIVTENAIGDQAALDAWENSLAEKIQGFALHRLGSGDIAPGQLEEMLKTGSAPELEREILGQFPEIERCSFTVKSARFPDFALYQQMRSLYENYLSRQQEYLSAALSQKAAERIDTQRRFDELEQYGALLTKYPVLLEYLNMEKK
jgi:hypothetical protein